MLHKNCLRCGKDLFVPEYLKDRKKFCSRECKKNQVGKRCRGCNQPFMVKVCLDSKTHYCSRACIVLHKRVTKSCRGCGKPMSVKRSQEAQFTYCSPQCRPSAEVRFWEKVNKTDGCWLWTATVDDGGYGRFGAISGSLVAAHRFSWEIHYGSIPEGDGYHGTCVLHKCDTPACVNPEHLFLGTQSLNIEDRETKGRNGAAKISGTKNVHAKLTDNIVRTVRDRYESGESQSSLAREFGVHQSAIGNVVRRTSWKHVD